MAAQSKEVAAVPGDYSNEQLKLLAFGKEEETVWGWRISTLRGLAVKMIRNEMKNSGI